MLDDVLRNYYIILLAEPIILVKGPVKLMQWVKIAHSFSQSVSNLFHFYHLKFAYVEIGSNVDFKVHLKFAYVETR